eukprot:CCRYP_010517-RA/>CCRYP_010517-RA protein AED:0.22 eAED:0.22 QI:3/1/1/1/1/1/2/1295/1277
MGISVSCRPQQQHNSLQQPTIKSLSSTQIDTMPNKKWNVATTVFSGRKPKPVADSKKKQPPQKQQQPQQSKLKATPRRDSSYSSDSDDDGSGSSSSSESHSSRASSKSGSNASVDSSGARIVKPIKLAALPNFDDSSDSSESEYGCGTYRRRESLSQSSLKRSRSSSSSSSRSISSDDDSKSSYSSSSDVHEQGADKVPTPLAAKEAPSGTTASSANNKNVTNPKSSFGLIKHAVTKRFRKKLSENEKTVDAFVPNKLDRFNPSTSSMGSRRSGASSIPSKRDSSSDEDSDDESSSSDDSSSYESPVSSKKGNKSATSQSAPASSSIVQPRSTFLRRRSSAGSDQGKNRHPSLSPTLFNEEQDKMMMRRRSSSDRNHNTETSTSNRGGRGPGQRTTRVESARGGNDRRRKDEGKSDVDNDFSKVLNQAKSMKEERRRRSSIEEQNNADANDRTIEDDDARLEKIIKRMSSAGESGGRDVKGSGSDDEMFQAPKLVFERQSMRFLFEKSEGSSETDDGSGGRFKMNHSTNYGNDDSSSAGSEGSGVISLSTESSSDDDNVDTVRTMSSDDECTNSGESQMSILTPIAEERVVSPTAIDGAGAHTKSDGYSIKSSSSVESFAASDLEEEETDPDHDRIEQRKLAVKIPNNSNESGVTRGDAMLTDMPDENDTTLSRRKAVQAIMRDSSLSAVDRNKKIQDIMAGRVELPIISKSRADRPLAETRSVQYHAVEPGPTGGEAMLTDMPDEDDLAIAKRKAVQTVMKDSSLGAVEKNKKIQDIMAGRIALPTISAKSSQEPVHTRIETPNNYVESLMTKNESAGTSQQAQNGKTKHKVGRRKKRPSKQSKTTNGDSKADSSVRRSKVSEESSSNEHAKKSPQAWSQDDVQASNDTIETLESSECQYVDETKDRNGSNASCHEDPEENPYSLLEIDSTICDAAAIQKRRIFQDALSSAESSAEKTPTEKALLTAMTLALHNLDSRWNLDFLSISNKPPSRNSVTTQRTLGERERISPWGKNMINDNASRKVDSLPDRRNFILDFASPNDQNVNKPRKPSRGLTKATSTTWRCSILGADTLRQTLFATSDPDLLSGSLPRKSESARLSELKIEDNKAQPTLSKSNIKLQRWASSFVKLDPRWQIRRFFDDASIFSSDSEIFTVWRPTSSEAISKMMRGEGVGKGLEIKGKSAKCGELSGYIPFLQIHEDHHKTHCRIPKSDRTKIFFKSQEARNVVGKHLEQTAEEMTLRVVRAKFALAERSSDQSEDFLLEEINRKEVENPKY